MKALRGRRIRQIPKGPPFVRERPYFVWPFLCPRCRGMLGWLDTLGFWQSVDEQRPDGSAFFRLPHVIAKCPHCPATDLEIADKRA